jgi:hypothetical protein
MDKKSAIPDYEVLDALIEEVKRVLKKKGARTSLRKYVIRNIILSILFLAAMSCKTTSPASPTFKITPALSTIVFQGTVDCNMAEVWIGDTFRIFSGKQGEDPVWGYADQLRFASGTDANSVFATKWEDYEKPLIPSNVGPLEDGLHGAVWFETVYQDSRDQSGKTLYALYNYENYPTNFPYNAETGEGYILKDWPEGLLGDTTLAAVCRIGIMKSTDGGRSWDNKGIILEDKQPRMILKPNNTAICFAGGVGDPSAVVSGNYLYVFYGEYGYPGVFDTATYNSVTEWAAQCISAARIGLDELDSPAGKAKRWDGKAFTIPYDGAGKPVTSLQLQLNNGGGPVSSVSSEYFWGPSVSWNTYLECWVMLMARAKPPRWGGSSVYISFNYNRDLGEAFNSQQWSEPKFLLDKPGDIVWYPSFQPGSTEEDIREKYTCLRTGKKGRLYFKHFPKGQRDRYISEYEIEFFKP